MAESPEDKPDIIFLVKEYVGTRIELFKLSAIEKATGIGSSAATGAFIAFMLLFALIFGSAALGYYLGDVTGSNAMGFGIVTLIYFLLGLIMIFIKSSVEKKLVDIMIKSIFNKKK
ncbi:MAG: hypothetical protein K0S09_1660 [Sphingobacteriaceae bacterium]|jgi:hypothetical protein|nr:hypothetical protein [Sphingobacteriaceae bacterium]